MTDNDNESRDDPAAPHGSWLIEAGVADTLFLYKLLQNEEDQHPVQVGPYRIIDLIEEGGMGAVYLAERTESITMKVALKLMKKGMASLEEISRFEVERQALALMNHPNIAGVKDAGATEDGKPFFVMEYVENGVPITEYCDRKGLGIVERLKLFQVICDAMQHAHQRAIIHRDLKPTNILVAEQEETAVVKVIDFGIAKIQDHETFPIRATASEAQSVMGTPDYMSPEQAQTEDIDTRTDVYALGVVLYELMVGVLPVEPEALRDGTVEQMLQRIRKEERPLPSRRLRDLDEASRTRIVAARSVPAKHLRRLLEADLNWIIQKALKIDPDERYQGVADLRGDVGRYLSGYPVLARSATPLYRLRKFLGRNRVATAAVVALITLSVAAGIVSQVAAIFDSQRLVGEGNQHWEEFLQTNRRKHDAYGSWVSERSKSPGWWPPWERTQELDSWRAFVGNRVAAERLFSQTRQAFTEAHQRAPFYSAPREQALKGLERANFERWKEAMDEGNVRLPPDFFKDIVESFGIDTYEEEFSGVENLRLSVSPPNARIYCFRYEELDEYLLPVPYDWKRRASGAPSLVVRDVDSTQKTFQPGDRIVEVRLSRTDHAAKVHPIKTRGDLARALRSVKIDEAVEVELLRGVDREVVRWIPYSTPRAEYVAALDGAKLPTGTFREPYHQFGLRFEGYSLQPLPECEVRGREGQFQLPLPSGSYLLLARCDGHQDRVVPIKTSVGFEKERRYTIELLPDGSAPEGFVHISGGEFTYGGDDQAYEGLAKGSIHVDGFFLGVHEVTMEEYLAFVNTPETLSRLNDGLRRFSELRDFGWVEPVIDWNDEAFKHLVPAERRFMILPWLRLIEVEQKENGEITAVSLNPYLRPGTPALGISFFAALEYVEWRTENDPKWRFRLPTDFEWEKAARGQDARLFVWGNYPHWTFCEATWGAAYPDLDPVGSYPLDESPYGIVGMAGSAAELVLTAPNERIPVSVLRFATLRGAEWNATDERDLHLASRNRVVPEKSVRQVGFRLVAEPKSGPEPP